MNKITLATLAFCALCASCSNAKIERGGQTPPIHALPEKYSYYDPEWESDESGDYIIPIEIMSDSVDYLTFPADVQRTPQLDSLVYTYNLLVLLNALESDLLTYSRELATPSHIAPESLDWLKEPELRGLIMKLDKAVCDIAIKEDYEDYNDASNDINEFVSVRYLNPICSLVDSADCRKAFSAESYVNDIDDLHDLILTDPKGSTKKIAERLLAEENFIPQTYIAMEYALSCYAHPDTATHDRELMPGLLEEIMDSGLYSPTLPEIWRMWRVRNQIYHSPSNDGAIYNHYYNTYRNKVAKTCLKHYAEVQAPDALINIVKLALEKNIIRQGFTGNSAIAEDIELFWEPTRSE